MYWLMGKYALLRIWVPPFGYPRIVVCVRLPEAFRRFLRPSSALYAKTSTVRSFSFNHLLAYLCFRSRTVILNFFSFWIDFRFNLQFLQLLQKDLSVFLLLFSFQRTSSWEISQISQNQTGIWLISWERLCSFEHLFRTSFSLERRWSIPTFS